MEKRTLIESFQSITDNYDNFIFDCDGVIWNGAQMIRSAISRINNLLENNKRIFFLSNTNSLSREDLYNKLIKAGVDKKFDYTHCLHCKLYDSQAYSKASR
jgi:4-nitrophenyl phosphatase